MLIVQPIGGLCNRIRSINSAYALAQSRNDTLLILWFCNEELNCPFEQLFQGSPAVRVINIYSKWNMKKIYYQLTSQFLATTNIFPHKITIDSKKKLSYESKQFFSSLKKRCYIATEESFYPTIDYSLFKPIPELQARITAFCDCFTDQTYGIHIRRTDNAHAIGSSCTESFVASMAKKIAVNASANFYLATDDLEEERTLKILFPGKILSNKSRNLSRNTPEGIQDALLDLFCLASTRGIVGSYYSSFTDIAADIGNIPKEIASIC